MFFRRLDAVLAVQAIISLATAQTSTSCNPLNGTCPEDVGLPNSTFFTDFTAGASDSWVAATGTNLTYGDKGAEFTINSKTEAPTIHTEFYIFFGYVEVKLRAANGVGIVSSIVLESDDLDEIDWEWLGGNNTSVETNYFGKGNTTTYDRAIYYDVDTPVDSFHVYALNWTQEAITWLIDGTAVRTLKYADALDGDNYPQTPCRLNLGVWAGGASSAQGTVDWAGGATDFDDAPFTMFVESVNITSYNPAVNYKWSGTSGSYSSIQLLQETVASNSSSSGTSGGVGLGSDATTSAASGASSTAGSASSSSSSSSNASFSQSTSAAAASGVGKVWLFAASSLFLFSYLQREW